MAQDNTKIHQGPARIFSGVTPGVTGTPPTYITHTDGVPATGTEFGHTEGDAIFTFQATKQEMESEQSLAPVDVATVAEMAQLEFTCQELVYFGLQRAFDNVGSETIAGGDAVYFGGGTSILAPRTECVMLTTRQRNTPTKFIITVLYKVYSVEGMKLNIGKKNKSVYKVTLKALADLSRNAGDQLGYFRREK